MLLKTLDGYEFELEGAKLWFISGECSPYRTKVEGRLLFYYKDDEIVDCRNLWPGETSDKVFCGRLGPFLSRSAALDWYRDDMLRRLEIVEGLLRSER